MIDQRFLDDLAQDLRIPEEPKPEVQLASANTGVTTDGGAFVGYRMNMPKGLNTPENMAKQSVLIADTLAGGGKGAMQGFVGLPGDLESIGRMALNYLGYNVDENTALPTSEEIGKRLESVLGPVVPQGQTTSVPTEERVRAAEGGELTGEILAPGGQVKLASKVAKPVLKATGEIIKAGKDLPVGMSIKMLDGTEEVIEKAPKTETKAFKNWFGNSKVIDDAGKPIVVYHGTASDITEFSKALQGATTGSESAKKGFFFTSDREVARGYAEYAAKDSKVKQLIKESEYAQNSKDWDIADELITQAEALEREIYQQPLRGQNVMPVYLSIKNPFVFDAKGKPYTDIEDSLTELIEKAKKKGHDGVIFKNLDDDPGRNDMVADHYVVFEPTQIKSAIGNIGTFDPKNPSIVKGLGVGGTGAAMSQEENK